MLNFFTTLASFWPTSITNQNQNNFYYLSLLKNDKNIYGFSIHGLWSQYGNGGYPTFCKDIPFDITKLKSIEKDLITFWELPNDTDKLEEQFWKHEWLKHGTCMFTEMNELEYFKKTLELYHKIHNLKLDIEKYKKGENYMIPFDLNFNLIRV